MKQDEIGRQDSSAKEQCDVVFCKLLLRLEYYIMNILT